MEGMRRMLSYVRRCVDDYEMIHPQDKIAVGLSGGKDSLALLVTLSELRRFYPHPFSLCAITVDMGFSDGTDYHWVQELCDRLEVPFYIQTSQIAQVIFDVRKEHNPCSLCAKMRRGLLNRTATQLGYSKVALGHHFDDVVETFMLNLFAGRSSGNFFTGDIFEPHKCNGDSAHALCAGKSDFLFCEKESTSCCEKYMPCGRKNKARRNETVAAAVGT